MTLSEYCASDLLYKRSTNQGEESLPIKPANLFCVFSFSMLVLSKPSFAESPDYLDFMDRADALMELVISAKSCESLGMIVDWEAVRKIPDRLESYAVRNGIERETYALPYMAQSIRQKREDEDFLNKYYEENPEKIDEYSQHWINRCAKLGANELTKEYVSLSEDMAEDEKDTADATKNRNSD